MMKRRILFVVAVFVAGAALGLVSAQQQMLPSGPDALSGDWKKITDEVALKVYTDRMDVRRATLYVRVGEGWQPVPVDGMTEIGPGILPSR